MVRKVPQSGFSLIEVIAAIGVLAILGGSLMPLLGRQLDSAKGEIVKEKLRAIREALENYHYEKKAFPTSLTDTTFLNVYLNPGVTTTNGDKDNPTYYYSGIIDDFYDTDGTIMGAASTSRVFPYYLDNASNPEKVWVWSSGPNRNDESSTGPPRGMSGDDIYIRACEEIPGRRRSELLLNIITFAYARKMKTAGARPAMAGWGTAGATDATGARVKIDLGIEFAYDGFGTAFVQTRSSAYLNGAVICYGPNQVVNSGTGNNSIGTGDDIRQ